MTSGTTAPASTFGQVAKLVRPELLIEIEVIAVVPAAGATPSR